MKMVMCNYVKRNLITQNKYIKLKFALFLLFTNIFSYSNDLKVTCIQLSEINYIIEVNNNSDSSIFIAEEFIVQQGSDSIWFDNIWSIKRNKFLKYLYKSDTIFYATNKKLVNKRLVDSVVCDSGPLAYRATPGRLVEIKKGTTVYRCIYYRTKFINPSYSCVRLFNVDYDTKKYLNYSEFERKESFIVCVKNSQAVKIYNTIDKNCCD